MPFEYYLGGAVALIVLLLLGMALTGRKSTRRVVVTKTNDNEELTRQVARAADALEALLAHLKARPFQAVAPVQEVAVRPAASPATVVVPAEAAPTVVVQKASEPPPLSSVPVVKAAPQSPAPHEPVEQPAATSEADSTATDSTVATENQKPRRVKLSMFGR